MNVRTSCLPWCLLAALILPAAAAAFTVDIRPDDRMLYLRVGDGEFGQNVYSSYRGNSSQPRAGGTRNVVVASVAPQEVGSGRLQRFSANARLTSDWDGVVFCRENEIYVGGFYRAPGTTGTGTLTAAVTVPLSNGTESIPFSQVGWTSSGVGDEGSIAQPIPDGVFADGARVIASFPVNVWQESCHGFYYLNQRVVAAGEYNGRVTYTLSAP
jgi:hypothetical protein